MKTQIAVTAIAAAVAVFSQGAFAQASSPTRAEVKAEAKAANKTTTTHGEAGNGDLKQPSTMSDKTRMQRKTDTKAALKAGEGESKSQTDSMKSGATAGSTTTRAERKATTKDALKTGQGTPKGDASASSPSGKSQ